MRIAPHVLQRCRARHKERVARDYPRIRKIEHQIHLMSGFGVDQALRRNARTKSGDVSIPWGAQFFEPFWR